MNEQEAKSLASQALPCPFCGESLVAKSDHHGWWIAHKDEPGDCIDSVTQLLHADDLPKWNMRDGIEHVIQEPDEWEAVGSKCRRCGAEGHVVFKVREDDEGHCDDEYHCQACEATWFVDGIDA